MSQSLVVFSFPLFFSMLSIHQRCLSFLHAHLRSDLIWSIVRLRSFGHCFLVDHHQIFVSFCCSIFTNGRTFLISIVRSSALVDSIWTNRCFDVIQFRLGVSSSLFCHFCLVSFHWALDAIFIFIFYFYSYRFVFLFENSNSISLSSSLNDFSHMTRHCVLLNLFNTHCFDRMFRIRSVIVWKSW